MNRVPPYKTVTIKPASGLLDARSTADEVPLGGWRHVLNMEVLGKSKMCRASGAKRLADNLYNNNADLHDQIKGTLRQPISFLWAFRQALGLDKLFAGTQNTLFSLNASTGNWRVIGDDFGVPETLTCQEQAWTGAGFGDVVVFTNGKDKPVWHVIDQPFGSDGQAVALIPDLELLKISAVGFVVHWNGLTFYCNVVEDGVRKSYRILWSDYQNPISVKPKASVSLAGYKDLAFGEVVLNAKELGNSLLFYTSTGVWRCDNAGGDAVLSFTKLYAAENPGERTLAFPRTLISTVSEHYFLANDGIYMFSYYYPMPQRVDWMHKASSLIFDDINTGRCLGHVGHYDTSKKQLKFSWVREGQTCPDRTLALNTEFPFASLLDYGATAYAHFGAARVYSVRQFILDQCICTPEQLDEAGFGFVKEGGFYGGSCNAESAPVCDTPPTCFWTNTGKTLDTGLDVEDFDQPEDLDSLCARLAGLTVGDLCNAEFAADQCKVTDAFIFADAADNCLKETDANGYYRQHLSDAGGCGRYVLDGYRSLLRSGPIDFGVDLEKIFSQFEVEAYPAAQTIPSLIGLKIGCAAQALDPNTAEGHCVILYQEQLPIALQCQSDLTAAEAQVLGIKPDKNFTWPIYATTRWFYFELEISNPEANPPDTGGSCCLSSIVMRVAVKRQGQL